MFNLLILDGDWEDEAVVQTGPVGASQRLVPKGTVQPKSCFNLDFNTFKY